MSDAKKKVGIYMDKDIDELIAEANTLSSALDGIDYLVRSEMFKNDTNVVSALVETIRSFAKGHARNLEEFERKEEIK